MAFRPTKLADAQMMALVEALCDGAATDHALAKRFGVESGSVRHLRRRLAEPDGWSCRIYWIDCEICGERVAGNHPRQTVHSACKSEWTHRYNVAKRQERLAAGYDEAAIKRAWLADPETADRVRRGKRERAREAARAWRASIPEPERDAHIDELHAQTAALQEQTRQQARNGGEPWTAAEDARLLAWRPRHPPQHELALELGRSLIAVRHRFHELRKRGLRPEGDEHDPAERQRPER